MNSFSTLLMVQHLQYLVYLRDINGYISTQFDIIKNDIKTFIAYILLQVIWLYVNCIPSMYINTKLINIPFGIGDTIGLIFWICGISIETLADYQKYQYKKTHKDFISSGLYKYSRHPNYLGEIIIWLGVCIICMSYGTSINDPLCSVTIIPLFFTIILLIFISGIPVCEKRGLEKYKDNKQYTQYLETTSIIIPIPPTVYYYLPSNVKKYILGDYYLY
ncbi:hypothetical protein WA158_008006 [Blastocystis sp. Blastoise]